ncbi:hypothetical protein [Chryseobacterium polytrichastri]|uniref:Uncharacterized protein n=1 Tax=Chryseobacterium polytrichastri TaxID=1302687 RepID=A0A1M6XJ82_9FLAO|nr:hypothetical protein [Chryseobacterium polytrichastri]SHL05919.1 hypothetical protein SAMN05444267_101128 [Chryseobacterium polytrichastri]
MKNLRLSGIVSTFTFHHHNNIVDLLSDNIVFFSIGYNLVDAFTFDHHL